MISGGIGGAGRANGETDRGTDQLLHTGAHRVIDYANMRGEASLRGDTSAGLLPNAEREAIIVLFGRWRCLCIALR